ncbi:MAG: hypothetical protein IJP95_02750, partial [Bacteroidales bacterium]|nr:hypothetical protein [Bacteroidales bacterium]
EQEKKIISLLLNYGNRTITQATKDEDGNEIYQEFYVAAIVVGDLLDDNIKFDNPLFQRIFDEYTELLQQGSLPDDQHFVNHPDDVVRTLAATLLAQPYTISDRWFNFYRISVPSPDDKNVIANDVHDSILNLKMKKLEQKISETKSQLKTTTGNEDIMILLGQIKQYESVRMAIAKELNRVIS